MENNKKKNKIVDPKKFRSFALLISLIVFFLNWGYGIPPVFAFVISLITFVGCEIYGRMYTRLYKKVHRIDE